MKLLRFAVALVKLLSASLVAADASYSQLPLTETHALPACRIAIIGAGAAGSSTAYHLRKFMQLCDYRVPLNITIFESESRIGGRTTTVNALDDPKYPTELGASIFVKVNHILYNATRDFGLHATTKIFQTPESAKYALGIWDGSDFVFTQANNKGSSWQGWWDIAKLLWKYGMSPIRTQTATRNAVGRFLRFYDEPIFPFTGLQDAVKQADLLEFTGVTGEQALKAAGISEQFSREIIEASTRVNYGQNLGGIHGLETLVCMAIEGAMAVEGGNWRIFSEAVKHSHAAINLNTTVTAVEKTDKGNYLLHTSNSSTADPTEFDTVILAAPYQFANITFTPPLSSPPPDVPYVSLHVTLLTTPHLLSPAYFNQATQSAVPSTILTTLPAHLNLGSARGREAVGPPQIWSVSTLRTLPPLDPSNPNSPPQYLYKIFSPAPLTATFLAQLFDIPYTPASSSPSPSSSPVENPESESDPITLLPKTHLSWSHTKTWSSYPYLAPTTNFSRSFLLDPGGDSRPGRGIYYTSSIEPFISTMETSALAGMNVARLIVDSLEAERVRQLIGRGRDGRFDWMVGPETGTRKGGVEPWCGSSKPALRAASARAPPEGWLMRAWRVLVG